MPNLRSVHSLGPRDLLENVQSFDGQVALKCETDYAEIVNSLNLPSLEDRMKILKQSLLYMIINNLAVFTEAPLKSCAVHYPYSTHYVHA